MRPYPNHPAELHTAAFCFRANALVRKKQQCWTCSWCQKSTEVLTAHAPEALQCIGVKSVLAPNAGDRGGRRVA